jgi:hypothetical protein
VYIIGYFARLIDVMRKHGTISEEEKITEIVPQPQHKLPAILASCSTSVMEGPQNDFGEN